MGFPFLRQRGRGNPQEGGIKLSGVWGVVLSDPSHHRHHTNQSMNNRNIFRISGLETLHIKNLLKIPSITSKLGRQSQTLGEQINLHLIYGQLLVCKDDIAIDTHDIDVVSKLVWIKFGSSG
jgi:hypothetical protein